MKLVELYRLKGPVPPPVVDKIVTEPVTVPEIATAIAFYRYSKDDAGFVTDTIKDKYSDYKIETTIVKLGVAEYLDQRSTLREGIERKYPELIDEAVKNAYSMAVVYDRESEFREIEQILEQVFQELDEDDVVYISSLQVPLLAEDHLVVWFRVASESTLRKIVAKWLEKVPTPRPYYMQIKQIDVTYRWYEYSISIKLCSALIEKSPLTVKGKVLPKIWDVVQNHVRDRITVTVQLKEPLAVLRRLNEVTIGKEINLTITELDLVNALLDYYHELKEKIQAEKDRLETELDKLERIVDGLRALKNILEKQSN